MPPILKCPICRKEVPLDGAEAPFCSERCRTIDLGRWASGEYKISSPAFDLALQDPDVLEDAERAQPQGHPVDASKWKQ